MTIKEMRDLLGASRAEFSRRYKIPIRSLENWESSTNKPPEYLIELLERAIVEDKKEDELKEALEEFYESCIRTGNYDMEENAEYFVNENEHMDLFKEKVLEILKQIDENN